MKPLLFRLDAEQAHRLVLRMVAAAARLPGFSALEQAGFGYEHPLLRQTLWGQPLPNPVGLAAGFDKDGVLVAPLLGLGFGLVELGTVTPLPQPGNPRPRLFRLPADAALINRMGFNNGGAVGLSARLAALPPPGNRKRLLGVNVGKNKDTPLEEAAQDYRKALRIVYDQADYLVINVSSPNTPGLRALQTREALAALAGEIAVERGHQIDSGRRRVPLLIKVAPELDEAQLADVAAVVESAGFDGIIATNTTLDRAGLHGAAAHETGGLSGKPLHTMALRSIRTLRRLTNGGVPLIGVGGIDSAEAAYAFIRAGASVVQIYTGLVYEGPGLVRRIKQGLVRLLQRDGFHSLTEAIGSDSTSV